MIGTPQSWCHAHAHPAQVLLRIQRVHLPRGQAAEHNGRGRWPEGVGCLACPGATLVLHGTARPPMPGVRRAAVTASPKHPVVQADAAGGSLRDTACPGVQQPQDAYGLEKLASEEICMHYEKDFGIAVRIARFHNIYGALVRSFR